MFYGLAYRECVQSENDRLEPGNGLGLQDAYDAETKGTNMTNRVGLKESTPAIEKAVAKRVEEIMAQYPDTLSREDAEYGIRTAALDCESETEAIVTAESMEPLGIWQVVHFE